MAGVIHFFVPYLRTVKCLTRQGAGSGVVKSFGESNENVSAHSHPENK